MTGGARWFGSDPWACRRRGVVQALLVAMALLLAGLLLLDAAPWPAIQPGPAAVQAASLPPVGGVTMMTANTGEPGDSLLLVVGDRLLVYRPNATNRRLEVVLTYPLDDLFADPPR